MNRLLMLLSLFAGILQASPDDPPSQQIRRHLPAFLDWLKLTDSGNTALPIPPDDLFDWEEVSRRALDQNWVNLGPVWRARLVAAIRSRTVMEIREWFRQSGLKPPDQDLRIEEELITGNKAQLTLSIPVENEYHQCTLRLMLGASGWKIYDVRTPHWRLVRDRLRRFDDMISNGFQLEYVETMVFGKDTCLVDDFDGQLTGDFPRNWGWKKKDNDLMRSEMIYRIAGDNPQTHLAARARNQSISLVRPFSYSLKEFPLLTWRWRARTVARTPGDPVASLTVIFYQNWLGVPLSITYVWSTGNATCTLVRNEGWLYDTHAVVLRNELDPQDEWLHEIVNPAEDFEAIFGVPPPDQTVGLYLLTGSVNGGTLAADYDDIAAFRGKSPTSCGRGK